MIVIVFFRLHRLENADVPRTAIVASLCRQQVLYRQTLEVCMLAFQASMSWWFAFATEFCWLKLPTMLHFHAMQV
jgi:hypothetical protein